jgi:bifunctional oligoribonuclease and PAP phosphatase NrnA
MERKDLVKISLRSKGHLPVNEFLSAHFQGGGHMNAAGGQSPEKLDATVERFMREIPGFLARHPA